MKYLVCKKQKGTGCDYSIGCGMTYEIINAVSPDHAKDLVIYPEDDQDSPCGIEGLDQVLIVPLVNMINIDIEGILEQHQEDTKKRQEEAAHAAEEAEYERLKKKLGKP